MGEDHTYRYVNTSGVPNSNSGTYNATTRSNSTGIDLGATHSYRYVRTDNVPNTNSSEYTFPANDTGDKKDLGATNSYRYVTATNVYNKGKADGATVHSGTYTFASGDTGGTKDLGTSHTYRYVNASNVYTKGKADGKSGATCSFTKLTNLTASSNQNFVISSSSSLASYKYCILVASFQTNHSADFDTASGCTIISQNNFQSSHATAYGAYSASEKVVVIGSITGSITISKTSVGTGYSAVVGYGIKIT